MKALRIWIVSLCAFLFATASIFGQQVISEPTTVKKKATLKIDKDSVKVQRHTVMSRFEPEIASTEEERLKKKQERIVDTERKLSILDTLDISERRRRALLRDLKYTPYSNRLNKATTLVGTEFEDTSDGQEN